MNSIVRFINENFGDIFFVLVGFIAKILLDRTFSIQGWSELLTSGFPNIIPQFAMRVLTLILNGLLIVLNYVAFFILLKLIFKFPGLVVELSDEIGIYSGSPFFGYVLSFSFISSIYFFGLPEAFIQSVTKNYLFQIPAISDAIAWIGINLLKFLLRIAIIVSYLLIISKVGFVLMDEARVWRERFRGISAIVWVAIGVVALLGLSSLYKLIWGASFEIGLLFDRIWSIFMGGK